MKKILFIAVILLSACAPKTHQWNVEVIYSTGEIDTIYIEKATYQPPELRLMTAAPGLAAPSGITPSLCVNHGFYSEVVVTGVRSYRVLTYKKANKK